MGMINTELFNSKFCFPQTEPDNQGKTRKLGIEPNFFKDSTDCEGLKFSYSFGKGEGLYYNASPEISQAILDGLRDILRKTEKDIISFGNTSGNRGQVTISVGRGDDLVPFIAISGEINGQRRSKKFFFPATRPTCVNMDMITLEKLVRCLETGAGEVHIGVSPEAAEQAKLTLDRMLDYAAR